MTLTREKMNQLQATPKRVVEPVPRSWTEERGQRRKTLRLRSRDGKHNFRLFLRSNLRFPENFTVGLAWVSPDDGEVTLLRCNGPHGTHSSQGFPPDHPHYGCHIHRPSPDDALQGVTIERDAEPTTEYATLEEAVLWLGEAAVIADLAEQLGVVRHPQIGLPFPEDV